MYNTFEHLFDVFNDHNTGRREATKAYESILELHKHIKERPDDMPILDKLKLKKTEVTIGFWESIYDVVESIIRDGHVAWKCRWTDFETLLSFLELPSLYPIDQVLPPELKLEEIERTFTAAKEWIHEVS